MTATPFLMFEGDCEAALALYVATLPNSRIVSLDRHGVAGPGAEGSVAMARALVAGLEIMANDSFVKHDFSFTPSLSLFVDVESEGDVDRIADILGEGGKVMMPAGDYGFSSRFAWVSDRFGVSWQINRPKA
ncbi:VOC family protein [soil metagenome]